MDEVKNEQPGIGRQDESKDIFTMMPLSISSIDAKILTMTEKVMLCNIINLSSGRRCNATNETFSLMFGMSTRQVTEHIRKLSEKGMILITGSRTRRYIKPTEKALDLFRKKTSIEEILYRRNLLKKKSSRTIEETLLNYRRNPLPENKENKRKEIYSANCNLHHSETSNSDKCSQGEKTDKEEMFSQFWAAWPNKKNKKKAKLAFCRIKNLPNVFPVMMQALEKQKATPQWQNQQFIPLPTTWINGERWNDEIEPGTAAPAASSPWDTRPWEEMSEEERERRDQEARRAAGFED